MSRGHRRGAHVGRVGDHVGERALVDHEALTAELGDHALHGGERPDVADSVARAVGARTQEASQQIEARHGFDVAAPRALVARK